MHFDDRLAIHARCGDIRGARFRFEYALERDGELVADGWTRHAVVDAKTLRPTRVAGVAGEASLGPRRRPAPVGGGAVSSAGGAVVVGGRRGLVGGRHFVLRLRLRLGFGSGFGFVPTRMIFFSPRYEEYQVSS